MALPGAELYGGMRLGWRARCTWQMPQLCSAPRYARTVECNGRRLLVSRFAHVLPMPRVSEDPLRKTSSSVQFGVIPARETGAAAADRFRNRGTEPRWCFAITSHRVLFLAAIYTARESLARSPIRIRSFASRQAKIHSLLSSIDLGKQRRRNRIIHFLLLCASRFLTLDCGCEV